MPKLVFPDGSTVYVKNGTTQFAVISSTGGIYHQGSILPATSLIGPLGVVTWPTTAAQTLANTTSSQALTNKTVNNITITDPGSAATLTITSGATLEAIGAFQHKFTSTANSAVTLPAATDATLMWTTETDGKITAKTSQINPLSAVTWPTTTAQTLVNTTSVQALTNKTVNNITITDPGTAATLTITSGGTLEAIGAFQHRFASTADSALALPGATDAVLMWTTELDGKITAKTSQINPLSAVTWPTTTAQTLVNTTDVQTLSNKTLGSGVISSLETATSDSVLTNYGISVVSSIAAGGAFTVGIAAPITGVRKTIAVAAANSSDTVVVSNGTSAVHFGFATTQTYSIITFSNPGIADMIGLSTVKYHILSLGSTAYAGTTTLPALSS